MGIDEKLKVLDEQQKVIDDNTSRLCIVDAGIGNILL